MQNLFPDIFFLIAFIKGRVVKLPVICTEKMRVLVKIVNIFVSVYRTRLKILVCAACQTDVNRLS